VRLATTTSTVASGLMQAVIPQFERASPYRVQVASRGTGGAIELCKRGQADVLLAHARDAEDAFVRAGYGLNRHDVMYNDFVLLGPDSDPAEVRNTSGIIEAFRHIAAAGAPYVSRGDNSGTHMRERSLLNLAGIIVDPAWYDKSAQGMLKTLELASARSAYALSDRATYLFNAERLDLEMLIEHDLLLYNPYGVTAVSPVKVPGVNFEGAMAFVDFLTGEEGQQAIGEFGVTRFGGPLFVPLALEAGP